MVFSLIASFVGYFLIPPKRLHMRDALFQVMDQVGDVLEQQVKTVIPRKEGYTEADGEAKAYPKQSRNVASLLRALKDLYSIELHSVSLAPAPPHTLKPLLKILFHDIGRNVVIKGGGPLFATLEETRFDQEGKTATLPLACTLSDGQSVAENLPEFATDLTRSLECCKSVVDLALDWHDCRYPVYSLPGLLFNTKYQRRSIADLDDLSMHMRTAQDRLNKDVRAFSQNLVEWLETDLTSFDESMFQEQHHQDRGRIRTDRSRNTRGQERLQMASWLVGVLDLAKFILAFTEESIKLYEDMIQQAKSGKRQSGRIPLKIWFPHINWKTWLLKPGASRPMRYQGIEEESQLILERNDVTDTVADDPTPPNVEQEESLVRSITREGQEATHSPNGKRFRRKLHGVKVGSPIYSAWRRFSTASRHTWDNDLLEARIRASRTLRAIKRSRHIRYALKMALGISLLSLPGLLPVGTAGRSWYASSRAQWAVVSYLYTLDVSTGATFKVGVFRLSGTIGGAVMAYVGYLISRGTAYGLVAIATVYSLPIAFIMIYSPFPGIGTVAGITIPPILFIPYVTRSSYSATVILALWRAEQVAVGIIAAWIVNTMLWPYHARVAYLSVSAKLLDNLAILYIEMSKSNLRPAIDYDTNVRQFTSLDAAIERYIAQSRNLITIQQAEISLLPKPVRLYGAMTDKLSLIFDTLIEIRMLRMSIPRKETVLDVIELRRGIVNSVYLNLFAVAHTVRSRQPIPQYLPRPGGAVNRFSHVIEAQFQSNRASRSVTPIINVQSTSTSASARSSCHTRSSSSPLIPNTPTADEGHRELSSAYFQAELSALMQLCVLLDDLVNIARRLFGTRAFLPIGTAVLDLEDTWDETPRTTEKG